MATRAEIRAKLGIKTLESSDVANKELTEYEQFMTRLCEFHKEIDDNIKNYCSRCRYYQTEESDKCDSWIHGSSYGVTCKYIDRAKDEERIRKS